MVYGLVFYRFYFLCMDGFLMTILRVIGRTPEGFLVDIELRTDSFVDVVQVLWRFCSGLKFWWNGFFCIGEVRLVFECEDSFFFIGLYCCIVWDGGLSC